MCQETQGLNVQDHVDHWEVDDGIFEDDDDHQGRTEQCDGVVVHREVVQHISIAVALSLLASLCAECQDAEA